MQKFLTPNLQAPYIQKTTLKNPTNPNYFMSTDYTAKTIKYLNQFYVHKSVSSSNLTCNFFLLSETSRSIIMRIPCDFKKNIAD
jgi:hypothetical protein